MPRGARRLPDACVEALAGADLIVHAGDFTGPEVLAEIRSLGPPLVAVHGNVDAPEVREALPERASFEAGGATIAVVHDAGAARGRLDRCAASSRAPTRSSSATPTCRSTRPPAAFRSSIPAARRSAAARPRTRWESPLRSAGEIAFELVELCPLDRCEAGRRGGRGKRQKEAEDGQHRGDRPGHRHEGQGLQRRSGSRSSACRTCSGSMSTSTTPSARTTTELADFFQPRAGGQQEGRRAGQGSCSASRLSGYAPDHGRPPRRSRERQGLAPSSPRRPTPLLGHRPQHTPLALAGRHRP